MYFIFNLLVWAAKKFLRRHTVAGIENVIKERVAVFVCNHAGSYGPVAMVSFFPYKFRPWVLYCSMTRKLCRKQLEKDLFNGFPRVLKLLGRFLAFVIEPPCLWVMRKTEAIPVYRGRNEIFRTFNISIEALKNGCNIVLFPENVEMKETWQLQDFNTGFVHLARKYYKATGKVLNFYPVYADQKHRSITIGKPVAYDCNADFAHEKERIVKTLAEAMRESASC